MDDPYLAVIRKFNQTGVRYVVVGMSGINYYAKDAREMFGTLDYDFFMEPSQRNVSKAIQILKQMGFHVGLSTGSFQPEELKAIVLMRATILATTPDGLMIELLLAISGYPFSELNRDATTFTVEGVPVKVGRLSKLLQSKRLADRPKDRQFLKRYESLLKEDSPLEQFRGSSHGLTKALTAYRKKEREQEKKSP